ncbi:Serine-type D-Ala-D-Ala carboxypeptidase [Ammonifex degensii KC4]|uniref:serine-type D-Ala-D-Ala carboxypeptidase n=1 Tax=Ammonifex degensii (strain DSM 10501 / KC4) TaxID=429009 RepID=C9RCM3_AMMDK|nr:D-alanyl-D-alanine carboxypeptidase family protein [Ammonifex degensii]ACX52000.1 Serine-type D-Ala-D-Ala carboxypeptidase [Ammonifex degensii KC4]
MRRKALFLTTLLAFSLLVANSRACASPFLSTTAKSAVLMEAHHGQILGEKELHRKQPIASMVKLMTLLLAVEAVEQGKVRLADKVTASEHAASMGGSQIFLAPEEVMSFRDLLIAVATASANDASVAVAEHVAGSEEAFVAAMNAKARALGMENTHYVNATGLPAEGQYSTAYDQALLLREALKHPLFLELAQIKEYSLRGGKFKLYNTNKLLWWYRGTIAGKTGWTEEAGYCLASAAKRQGLTLITVVLGCPEPRSHFRESIKIYNWGFARYQAVPLLPEGARVATLPVEKGMEDRVDILTSREVVLVVPRGEDKGITQQAELPRSLKAPLQQGEKVGYWIVKQGGQEKLRVSLVTACEVAETDFYTTLRKVFRRITKGP